MASLAVNPEVDEARLQLENGVLEALRGAGGSIDAVAEGETGDGRAGGGGGVGGRRRVFVIREGEGEGETACAATPGEGTAKGMTSRPSCGRSLGPCAAGETWGVGVAESEAEFCRGW